MDKPALTICERWLHRREYDGCKEGISYWKCTLCGDVKPQFSECEGG